MTMHAAHDPAVDKRAEVLVLLRAGHTRQEIAGLTGVSVSTIGRLARTARSTGGDGAPRRTGGRGRPPKAEPFRGFVVEHLRQGPARMSKEILREAQAQGYTGGKTAMYTMIAELRRTSAHAAPNIERTPGAVSEHEVGLGSVRFVSGGAAQVVFLASRLAYSRWLEVSLVPGYDIEALLRALVRHFARMGGLPLSSSLFAPKRIALRVRRAGIAEWHPALGQAALDLGVGLILRSAADWARSSEPLARWVKDRFFKSRRFRDMLDVHAQLAEWIDEVNHKWPSRVTREAPLARMDRLERSCLRPLPTDPRRFAVRLPAVVSPAGEVRYERAVYKLPPDTAGMLATLCLEESRLSILVGSHRADYERLASGLGR